MRRITEADENEDLADTHLTATAPISPPEPPSHRHRRWLDPVVLATIVSAFLGATVSSFVAWRLQSETLHNTTSTLRLDSDYTVALYASYVEAAQGNLRAALQQHREVQSAIVLSDLDLPSAAGVAFLTAGTRPQALTDLTAYAGQLRIVYQDFSRDSRTTLTGHDIGRVCRTIGWGEKVLLDFKGVPHAGVASTYVRQRPAGCST
jgi:hypothetical protein